MTLSQQEFDAILADDTKRIVGDIEWQDDEDHSPAREFRVEVSSEAGYPLFVNGRCNPKAGTLSYTIVHRQVGRIYGLDPLSANVRDTAGIPLNSGGHTLARRIDGKARVEERKRLGAPGRGGRGA